MMLGLKIFGLAVGVYASVRMASLSIKWMKSFFDELAPDNVKKCKYKEYDKYDIM